MRLVWIKWIPVAVLICRPVCAADIFCSWDFATMAGPTAEQERTLVLSAYDRLLDLPLAEPLDTATVERMIAGQHPFRLPAEGGNSSPTLRRHLAELGGLVAQKGWNTPELDELLLGRLALRLARTGEAETSRERAEVETGPDFDLPVSMHARLIPLPCGRDYFLQSFEIAGARSRKYPAYIVDGMTGKVARSGGSPVYPSSPTLSPSGQEILYGGERGVLWRVPLTLGRPKWRSMRKLGDDLKESRNVHAPQISPGGVAYAAWIAVKHPAFRYDLATGERVALDWSTYLNKRKDAEIVHWGTMRGSENLFVVVRDKVKATIEEVSVSEKGEVRRVGTRATTETWVSMAEWPRVDGPAYWHTTLDVRVAMPGGTDAVTLLDFRDRFPLPKEIKSISAHPTGESIAALVVSRDEPGKPGRPKFDPYVEWVDAASGRTLARVTLSISFHPQKIEFFPDGRLHVSGAGGLHQRVLNLEARRQ